MPGRRARMGLERSAARLWKRQAGAYAAIGGRRAILIHLRDERGRFQDTPERSKNRLKRDFMVIRRACPPAPALHKQSSWADTSGEV
ncbi:hypothetical protein GSI_03525 [Ganoderma sinense ZZ0214-1]|uniref:Uncharacterized protein n=1 Tax=Ganoderma sinense ZZ0214-1 TaxID=1077348 RepID=A0A2G8SLV1_9APHY|nr:hypothetical protein GSI_03525 [Ganoderma sinense ZZ0214-1]